LKSISDNAIELIHTLSGWYAVRDKHAEKLGIDVLNNPYDDDSLLADRFEKLVLRFRSLLSWHVGAHAQSLLKIAVKEPEKKKEDEDKDEAEIQKEKKR
jgi:hypothetical protein